MKRIYTLPAVLLALTALLGFIYTQAGQSEADRLCRERGCYICHRDAFAQPLDCLRTWQKGQALSPPILAALQQQHPWLSRGAEEELAEYLARLQLPSLQQRLSGNRAESLYLSKCAACHGRQGEGKPEQYPPLAGSEWITQEPSRLPEILTQGLQGPITVKGQLWNSTMLPPGIAPADHELLIRYLRDTFAP